MLSKSTFLVFLQFALIVLLLISGVAFPVNFIPGVLFYMGFALGIYSVFVMKLNNFTISAIPLKEVKLANNGPYRYIRHPMYTSVLVCCIALVIESVSWYRILLVLMLLVVFIVKLTYEESLLIKRIEAYEEYKRNTWRILPWVY